MKSGICVLTVFAAAACGPSSSGVAAGDGGGNGSAQNDATSPSPGEDATAWIDTYVGSNVPEDGTGADVSEGVQDASDAAAVGDAGGGGEAGDGAVVTASCTGTTHPVCIDFESGKIDAPWTGPGNDTKVDTGNAAHGRYALHLSNLQTHPILYLQTSKLTGITDQMWGRFYLYMDPAAPVGHGALVRADDIKTNWDEVGFEANGADPTRANDISPTTGNYFADWHTGVNGNPEKYMRSKDNIPHKKWACVEFFFDGATPSVPRVWGDGIEVMFDDIIAMPNPQKAVQFVDFKIGITFYHGGSTVTYEGNTMPLTDEWIDDIALDTTRIGCL
jgi:hypothetical protein